VFGRHQDSRIAAASVHSVIGTCVLNGIDPRRYLAWILPQLLSSGEFLFTDALLPWACPEALRVGAHDPVNGGESDVISLNS
jgi:hypothetical protein